LSSQTRYPQTVCYNAQHQ